MNLIFLGPPGAGKGTQAKILEERHGYRQISTGDILRRNRTEGTALGIEAQGFMDAGALVPDDLIIRMMAAELDAAGDVILDGFPRTVAQAEALDLLLAARKREAVAVLFDVDLSVLMERLTGRWTHAASGRAYHVKFNPPKTAGLDDVTGEPLMQRNDDKEETIRTRLAVYETETAPLIEYYGKHPDAFVRVDALGAIADVTAALEQVVQRAGAPT